MFQPAVWYTSVILTLGRQEWESCKFDTNLDIITGQQDPIQKKKSPKEKI